MQPYVPVVNTVQVELRQMLDSNNLESSLYFHKDSAWSSEDMQNMGGVLIDWWATTVATQLSAALTLVEVFVTDLTTQTSGVASVTNTLPTSGQVNLESMPSNVAACISFHTANRGRSFRGRNYIGGLPENTVATNTLNAGVLNVLRNAYQGLYAVADGQGATWVVVSRFSGMEVRDGKLKPKPRTVGLSTAITNAAFTDNIVDSVRGRLPRH